MPVHNGMPFLTDALSAVQAQTHRRLELIVVDDGSTDDSLVQVQAFTDPRIRLFRQANAGTAAARNRGIRDARGALVGFLDQDDLWLPGKLEVQVEAMVRDPGLDLVLCHVWQGWFDAGSSPAACLAARSGRRLAGYLPSALLVRRTLLDRIGGFREHHHLAESFEWFVRVREGGFRSLMLPEVLAVRRVHAANKGRSLASQRGEYARVLAESLRRRRSVRP